MYFRPLRSYNTLLTLRKPQGCHFYFDGIFINSSLQSLRLVSDVKCLHGIKSGAAKYKYNWVTIYYDARSPSKTVAIRDYLRAFGENSPESWTNLSNVNRLCSHCHSIDWDPARSYLAIADEGSLFPKIPLYGGPVTLQQVREAAHWGVISVP